LAAAGAGVVALVMPTARLPAGAVVVVVHASTVSTPQTSWPPQRPTRLQDRLLEGPQRVLTTSLAATVRRARIRHSRSMASLSLPTVAVAEPVVRMLLPREAVGAQD
jgi:hypothetical protein